MSEINFRLYGEQIYGLACTKIKDFITPEIEKESFTTMFKEGQIKYSNIKNKEKISVHSQITINNLEIENLSLNIPNETENFSMNLSGVKTTLELNDINENEIEKKIIEKRKKLIEKFISYAVKKIENKESSKSFIEGLIENLVNRAINGLKIEINNIEIKVKYKNNIFVLFIENISYSEENGIHIKNIAISYENEENKDFNKYIIKQFNVDVEIKKAEDETKNNELNVKISDFQLELTKNIIYSFNEIYNLTKDTKYKYVYVRNKKLIQYYRPGALNVQEEKKENQEENNENKTINEDKNKYYNSLWLYAIKTVIKLQKYVGYDKLYLLDLPDFIQNNIAKQYIDDNNKIEKLILPTEINLLKATKEKVEKQVLDGKKGNALANAFSFFFGGKKDDDEKKELSEEEKEIYDNIYTDEYLINYLYGNNKDENKSNPIKDKIMGFISKLTISTNFNKLELILANDEASKCTLYISDIKIVIEKLNDDISSIITIGNIGSNLDENLFNERMKINDNNDVIMVSKDKNNKIKIDLGFKNIELNEELFNFILIFFSSLKMPKKNRIFKKIKYDSKPEEEPKNEDAKNTEENNNEKEKNENNNEICKNLSISNIPSLVISNNGNKIFFSIINYSITPTKILITYNIKDSFGTILDNYTFILNKDEKTNKYTLNLETPLRIILSKETSKSLFISLLKLKERLKQTKNANQNTKVIANNEEKNNELEKELYDFNYVIHKNIDIKNFNLDKLQIELIIEKLAIEIYENEVKSKFSINDFNLTYENKNLSLKIGKISISTNLMSTMVMYLAGFEAPNFKEFQKYIDSINNEYEENNKNLENNLDIIDKKENNDNKKEGNIKYDFNMDNFLNSFKVYINLLIISFQAYDNIISYASNKIRILTKEEMIVVKLGTVNLTYKKDEQNSKNIKILTLEGETSVDFDPKKKVSLIKIVQPKINIDIDIIKNLKNSFKYLLDQLGNKNQKSSTTLMKVDLKVLNTIIKINNEFTIMITEIIIKNYDDNKNDTKYLTINNLEIKNKNNELITKHKNLYINYITKSITEKSLIINFSDLNIYLSKNDINILSQIFCDNKPNDIKENDIPQYKPRAPKPKPKKKNQDNNLSIDINFPLIDLCLCSQNRIKKCELILSPLEGNAKIFIPADYKNINDIHKNINIALGKLNLLYKDNNAEEYNIIEYKEKEKYDYNSVEKSMISFEPNLNNKNQIEINLNNEKNKNINDIVISVNKLGINLKLNILMNLLLYIKDIIPKNINKNNNNNNNKEIINNCKNEIENENKIKFHLNLNEFQFKFDSINNNMGEIYLNINKINYIFSSLEDAPLPFGYNEINLDKFYIILINNNEINKIIFTKNNFMLIKGETTESLSDFNIIMNEIFINLSFTDIYLIKDMISSNISYFNKNKNNLCNIIEKKKEEKYKETPNKILTLNYNMKGLDIILIDNYSNNYQPFLNLKLNNLSLILKGKKTIIFSVNITLLTYNYISCVWEPFIENSCIKSMLIQKKEKNMIGYSFKIEIYQLLLNISDMFIGSTVLSLNNLKKLLDSNKNYNPNNEADISNSRISFKSSVFSSSLNDIDILPEKKQTNNKIINYTGKKLKIQFNNKIYNSTPSVDTELEYINNFDKQKNKIIIYYDNNTLIDIPFLKLGNDFYKLNDEQYLVWENIISKERQINIILYSQIIFKNKTNYTFQIKLINNQIGNLFILIKPNSKAGIPLEFCNSNTSFIFLKINEKEINNNQKISLSKIINISNEENYQEKINIKNKSLLLKLQKKIEKISTLLITTEYSIINCLPCDIILETKNKKGKEKIKKCSQFLIDFCSDSELEINLIIKTSTDYFYSEFIKLYKLVNNYEKNEGNNIIEFKNNKGQSFNLSFFLKNKDYHKSLIIYSEYILYNDSGINFKIHSNFLFGVAENLYLISNKINLENSNFKLSNNILFSKDINLKKVIKASPYYQIQFNNENYNLPLTIKKNLSFISLRNNPNFRENIISMVFYILPICKIINLFSNKKLILRDNKNPKQYIEVAPLDEVSFNFFNRNKNNSILELGLINVNENKYNTVCLFNSFQYGIYTFFSDKDYFNLEIKDSSNDGILNIFVTETTLKNAKIVVINKTKINFEIYQNNYDKYKQIINENESQILKIYDQNNTTFNVGICGKKIELNFVSFKEEFSTYPIGNSYILIKESNGVKMKITLYTRNEYDKLNTDEIKLYGILVINKCYISLIGDNFNKNRKLRNYERNEIILIYFQNFNTKLEINKSKEIIKKNNIELNLNLSKIEVFNQLSKTGKYSCIFKNIGVPCMNLIGQLNLYKEDQVAKINKFTYSLKKLKLNIDPQFILEIINFADNISYRLGKINFNVDKVFLRTNKNIRDIKIKDHIKKYKNNQKLICYGSEFNFPSINIDYELTEINLEKLLREKVGCTDLLVWLGFGLVRQNQNIFLEKFTINKHFGDISGLILKIQNNYKSQMTSVILNMGLKGFIGQIKQFFKKDKTDENSFDVQKNRIRYPRAFYGKYKYIKNYSEEEAKIIDKFISTYQKDFKEIYCNDLLQNKNYIFYFSGLSLFICTKNYELYYKIDFKSIDKVYNEEENLIIKYKKENEEENPPSIINCDEVYFAKRLIKLLDNYVDKNTK